MTTDCREPFGWLTALDLYGCDDDRLTSAKWIEEYVVSLCDEVLLMKRYGEPFIEWFGLSEPKTAGYSVVQLIETSSVVGHFSGDRGSAHIDVFSCKAYDVDAVKAFSTEFFGAERATASVVTRD